MRRPDIRAAERRLAAADADVAAAARRRFPSLTLTGTLGFIATALTGVFTADALAAYRGAVLDAVADVDTELARARAARERGVRLDAQVRADTDAADITRIQYRRGLTDFLGVLDAQRSLSAARDAQLAEQAAAVDAALRLWRAAGGDAPAQVDQATISRDGGRTAIRAP